MEFPSTNWTLLAEASLNGSAAGRKALEELCGRYWAPIYRFIRSRDFPAPEAQDLTQDFMLHLLDKSLFSRAEASRGRFRSFLLGALVRFMADATDKQRAVKRGGGQPPVSLDSDEFRDRPVFLPAQDLVQLFDREWAIGILESAMAQLHDEYAGRKNSHLYTTLQHFLPGSSAVPNYEQTAQELGISPGALKTEVHRLRRRLRALVREEVARTVSAPHDIEPELTYLQKVLMDHGLSHESDFPP
jgi:DNA-directed RNA polymerase specialized sigma24 family protein